MSLSASDGLCLVDVILDLHIVLDGETMRGSGILVNNS